MTRLQEWKIRRRRFNKRSKRNRSKWHGKAKYGNQISYPHGTHKTPYNPRHQGVRMLPVVGHKRIGPRHQHITFVSPGHIVRIKAAKYGVLPLPWIDPYIGENGRGPAHWHFAYLPYYNRRFCRLGRTHTKLTVTQLRAWAAWNFFYEIGRVYNFQGAWPSWDPYHRTPVWTGP